MGFIQTAVLALLQGLTEFLPISSSAHLILVPVLTGWPDQGLEFDVAVHVGTLAAIILYFRGQIAELFSGWLRSVSGKGLDQDGRLAWAVLFGTIPVGLAGLAFESVIEDSLRGPLVIAATTIIFGLALWAADHMRGARNEESITWKDVLVVGAAQAIALIPGTSRSGITMTAGLFMGLNRVAAARFSFLLSIPVTALAGMLETWEIMQSPAPADWETLGLGALLAFIAAYVCIHFFLKWLPKIGMLPFVIYRLLLGAVLLVLYL
ncbi:MAG TPA: undecaprenyl-diphosphate phosphatase [Gammaproteobacteria bacterium]